MSLEEHQQEEKVNPEQDLQPPEAASATSEGARLKAEVDEALREKEQFRSLLQRVQADFINYKRRMEEEREEIQKQANAALILKLLPILDDLKRALEHVPGPEDHGQWMDGIRLIERNLSSLLESFGTTKIEAAGKQFNPWEHEAILFDENSDQEEGTVLQVIREGYKLHGKVLRAAQVSVSKPKKENNNPPDNTGTKEA